MKKSRQLQILSAAKIFFWNVIHEKYMTPCAKAREMQLRPV
jgi:hypothetical protein